MKKLLRALVHVTLAAVMLMAVTAPAHARLLDLLWWIRR